MKSKVGKLGEEVKEFFTRYLRKEFTGVVGRVLGKKRFLVDKDMGSNKITIVTLESRTNTK